MMNDLTIFADTIFNKLRPLCTNTHSFQMARFQEDAKSGVFLCSILYASNADFKAYQENEESNKSLYKLALGTRMADITVSTKDDGRYELSLRTEENDKHGIGFLILLGESEAAIENAAHYIFDFLVMGTYPTTPISRLH